MARQFDQACIVHAIWLRLAVTHTAMWVTRVPTKDNIADDPSRCIEKGCVLICAPTPLCVLQGILRIVGEAGRHSCAWRVARRFSESHGMGSVVSSRHCQLNVSATRLGEYMGECVIIRHFANSRSHSSSLQAAQLAQC